MPGPWEQEVEQALDRATGISLQRFCFLNREVLYPEKVNWHDPTVSQLWRYHLHYFDYVEDLLLWSAAGHDSFAWDAFRSLVDSWIADNERITGDGWHPFTISVRVVNWLNAFHFWKARFCPDVNFARRFKGSLHCQISILASSLERDVGGNHLLKNLRALIWSGIAFEDAQITRCLSHAIEELERELARQILSDGGHFERAPGYHAAVLKDCIDIGLWLRRNLPGKTFQRLDDALQRMLHYLMAILPPDQNLPLLKDTARGVTPTPGALLAAGALYFGDPKFKITEEFGTYPLLLFGREGWDTFQNWPSCAGVASSMSLPESGYYVMRNARSGDYLIFDGGKVCPDCLPAHAHADMFSYELMIQGQRVIVDSGIYEYTAGRWRDYFRSTRAHNTVEVERRNQSEVWGSFRVARRAHPHRVVWDADEAYVLVHGSHDGYACLRAPAIHKRILLWVKGSFWLIVDVLASKDGRHRAEGNGLNRCRQVLASSHVHLYPNINVEQIDSYHWRLVGISQPLWLQAFGHHASQITAGQDEPFVQGWFSESFGERIPNTVISFHHEGRLPFLFGYSVSRAEHLGITSDISTVEGWEITVEDGKDIHRLIIEQDNVRFFS